MTFTGMLFQPVPWSMQTKKGMPADFEKYAADAEYVIINIPPNFMFQVRTIVCQSAISSSGMLLMQCTCLLDLRRAGMAIKEVRCSLMQAKIFKPSRLCAIFRRK